MPTFRLEHVSEGRQWTGNYGVNEDFTLRLHGVEKPAILTQKPGTAVPKAGDTIELTLEPHPRFDDKLKAKRVQQGGGFNGPRPEDPKRQAAIVRQHSQTAALTVLDLKQRLGVLTPEDLTPGKLQQLADFFDDDVRHGVLRSEKPR